MLPLQSGRKLLKLLLRLLMRDWCVVVVQVAICTHYFRLLELIKLGGMPRSMRSLRITAMWSANATMPRARVHQCVVSLQTTAGCGHARRNILEM